MDLLIGTSFLAAFVAGVAALLAPCCITVLLPSYFGSVFKTKTKVFFMTFMFFLGILAVFLPLGLGFSAVGQFLRTFHNAIYIVGSLILIGLGLTLVTGMKFSMPFSVHPSLRGTGAGSIFLLGVFSGIATTCCAPVLAGVLALSTMAGSVIWGVLYTVAYVLGMVTPLFFFAAFLDRSAFLQRFMELKRHVTFSLFGRKVSVAMSDLISGTIFVLMGGTTLYLALTNRLFMQSAYQTDINIYLTKLLDRIGGAVAWVPNGAWAFLALAGTVLITVLAVRQLKQR